MVSHGKATRGGRAATPPVEPGARHYYGRLSPRNVFLARIQRAAAYALVLVGVTLGIGMAGYRGFEHMSWLDAFHQAALLLSGMGPVVEVKSTAGKLFDGIYALFCGVILLASTGLLFTPVLHRILHRFHIEDAHDR